MYSNIWTYTISSEKTKCHILRYVEIFADIGRNAFPLHRNLDVFGHMGKIDYIKEISKKRVLIYRRHGKKTIYSILFQKRPSPEMLKFTEI